MVFDLAKAAKPDFAAIFQTLPGMFLLLSPDFQVLDASDASLHAFGATREAIAGKSIQEVLKVYLPESRLFFTELATCLTDAKTTGKPASLEMPSPEKEGECWQFSCIPIPTATGGLNSLVLQLVHKTHTSGNSHDCESNGEQFKFLADSIPQLVWTTDPKGYHDYFNQRWTDFTGYSLEDSRGPDMWNNLLHPDDRARARDCWNRSLETGQAYEIEYRFKSAADGRYYWFLGRALPMRDEQGKIVKWFGTCTDISRKKQFEEELKEKNQEMKLINDDLDSFVYMASHDLKLPVINISTLFEELLLNVDFRDAEAQVMVDMIRKSLRQVGETINDLGEIVKVQKNVYTQLEEINLQQLLAETKLSLVDLIASSEAVIEADFSQAPTLHFSKVNLKSVLYNLLSNAIKFRSPERVPFITLRSFQTDGNLRLEISDNGIGIDLNKHGDKLFQMFKRFHNHVEGSGLGLHIISRIMHKSGGYIEVDSQQGQGTTFSLIFTTTEANNGRS